MALSKMICWFLKQVLIATGSRPAGLPGCRGGRELHYDSDHALEMDTLPQSMVIVGGGVIGVEWASMLGGLWGRSHRGGVCRPYSSF